MTKDEQWLLEEKHAGKATAAFEKDRDRLAKGEPTAYVIGFQPFLGLRIYLGSHPLIPRVETEWWVENMLKDIALDGGAVLDLCAGSGAIGCAVLKECQNAHVYFGEIESAHRETILKNIRENNLDDTRTHVLIGNLFEPFGTQTFDVIASNPPYIPEGRLLPESVSAYEPHEALFSGIDGLGLITKSAEELPRRLNPGGKAWIECDSLHAKAAQTLFEEHGFNAHIIDDQYGAPRVVVVTWK